MLDLLRDTFFILASTSPRRIDFLKQLNLKFKVVKSCFAEENCSKIKPAIFCRNNAKMKALKVSEKAREQIVTGFDTIVSINGKILGKPKNKDNCREMLRMLSGKTHCVFTAYSFVRNGKVLIENLVRTSVEFKELSDEEISWYISTKEPFDKAGGYAIQGIGAFLVKKINGSYTNVVGLPLAEFLDDFKKVIS